MQAGTGYVAERQTGTTTTTNVAIRAVSGEAPTARQPSVVASNYRAIAKNTLIASVDLTVTKWRFTFRGCLHHRRGDREWISFPAREWIAQDGTKKYADLGGFDHRDDALWFQRAALDGIHQIAGREGRQ